jgi:hypothetical protein
LGLRAAVEGRAFVIVGQRFSWGVPRHSGSRTEGSARNAARASTG